MTKGYDMQNTVLLKNQEIVKEFKDEQWIEIVGRISDLFCLSAKKSREIMFSKTYKLIAAIPFLAGCDEALKTSLSHMAITYMAADNSAKDVFSNSFHDTNFIQKRLERISHFSGGDREVIDRGMNLLAYMMISDQLKNYEEDSSKSGYSNSSSTDWNPENEQKKLEEMISSTECISMDNIMTLYEAKSGW